MKAGDTLAWDICTPDGAPQIFPDLRIRFVSAPIDGGALLADGDVLRQSDSASIRGSARAGRTPHSRQAPLG